MSARRTRTSIRILLFTALIAASVLPSAALAVEHEHAIGLDLGPAVLVVANKGSPDIGGTAGLHYTYGLTDAFNLVADAQGSLVALKEGGDSSVPRTRPTTVFGANVGLAYVLDVLRWVPWGAAEIGGYAMNGGTIDGVHWLPGAVIAVGLDYRLNRSWALGAVARQTVFFTETSTYPSFTQVLGRFEYVWGW
jgi:hypothetical protein